MQLLDLMDDLVLHDISTYDDINFDTSNHEQGYQNQHVQFYKTTTGVSITTTTVYVLPTLIKCLKSSLAQNAEPLKPLTFAEVK